MTAANPFFSSISFLGSVPRSPYVSISASTRTRSSSVDHAERVATLS